MALSYNDQIASGATGAVNYRPGTAGYTSKPNNATYQQYNNLNNAANSQASWMNQLLVPAMRSEVAEQESRESDVWKMSSNQASTLNNLGMGQNAAGQSQSNILAGQQGAANRNATTADMNATAEQQRYSTMGRQAQDNVMRQAADFNSGAYAEQQAGLARADTSRAFQNQMGQDMRQKQAYGINPASGAGMDSTANRNAMIAQSVGAGNRARQAATELGWGKAMEAANVGQQMFANSQASGSQGMQQRQLAAGLGAQSVEMKGAGAGLMGQGLQAMTTGYNAGQSGVGNVQGMGNTLNQSFETQAGMYNSAGNLANQDYSVRSGAQTAKMQNKTQREGNWLGAIFG